MEFLSRLLSSVILGLFFIIPVHAYVPDYVSISELSEARKELIRMGHHAPFSQLTVKRVVVGKARVMPNGAIINLPHGPDMVPSFYALQYDPKWQVKEEPNFTFEYWTENEKLLIDVLFWTSQVLDVYSTYRGLKYDCVREANPLLSDIPEVPEMIGLKLVVIGSLGNLAKEDVNFWYGWKLGAATTTSIVVANNFRILRKAEGRCDRR